ncbi:unnamed protein product [Linum tenue]|uniref:CCDC93 coiled-coil domain-containing protein n=1 Tax=Linum tenue TaxID=586396 RepID=A0AAV0K7N0_9ROSI|nr:unnamed protein product [Linum tenue]
MLNVSLDEQNRRKADVLSESQKLRERIDGSGCNAAVDKLIPILESLKSLENEECVLRADYDARRAGLEADVCELEDKVESGSHSESLSESLDSLLEMSLEKLDSAKKELAGRLRAVLLVKRQIDDVATQAEVIQYDRRLSELNAYIQEKHQQTRKHYDTYNALLEIKDLMLKETSLLNSINSQFQDAITSADGRMKLIASMEGIVKNSQQKLRKLENGLDEEQMTLSNLKKKYAAAMSEQRHCYSLLKAFQEECSKNERLRGLSAA